MKDWEEYESKKPFVTTSHLLKGMMEDIDNTRLTKAERDVKIEEAQAKAKVEKEKINDEYREDGQKLRSQFWLDCREDIGYDKFLTNEAVVILECRVWEERQAEGLSNVYSCLVDLAGFVQDLIKAN